MLDVLKPGQFVRISDGICEAPVTWRLGDRQYVGVVSCTDTVRNSVEARVAHFAQARPNHEKPLGVLIQVGAPQYRVGSQRQFVLMARFLAQQGHCVLRYDIQGLISP